MRVVLSIFAPVMPRAARAIGVPRTLDDRTGVALTFDDGPHPEGTPAVLEILAREGVSATFFLVGEQVERHPALAARIAEAGHVVGLHGFRHRLQLRMTSAQLQDDIERGLAAIHDATGVDPRWHRPPYGIYSQRGLRAALQAGLKPLLWSRWGKDWRRFTTPARIAARATKGLSVGDVILLHDADFYSSRNCHERTIQALPAIISAFQAQELATVLPS